MALDDFSDIDTASQVETELVMSNKRAALAAGHAKSDAASAFQARLGNATYELRDMVRTMSRLRTLTGSLSVNDFLRSLGTSSGTVDRELAAIENTMKRLHGTLNRLTYGPMQHWTEDAPPLKGERDPTEPFYKEFTGQTANPERSDGPPPGSEI